MSDPGSGRSPRPEARLFLATRLILWSLAEVLCVAGNLLSGASPFRPLALGLWRAALRLNRHQEVAAMNWAVTLLETDRPGAWTAFETVLEQLDNPWDTSASDLHLSRTPGRALRRLLARLAWGGVDNPADATDAEPHDRRRIGSLERLAREHFARALAAEEDQRAERALEAWRSTTTDTLEVTWAEADLAWARAQPAKALGLIAPLVARGRFVSPLDTVRWGARLLDAGELKTARQCLALGRQWVPELPRLWRLLGALAVEEGRSGEALALWERALALDPQDLDTFLQRLRLQQAEDGARGPVEGEPAATLEVEVPDQIALGETQAAECRLTGVDPAGWSLWALPPAGWGLVPTERQVPFDDRGRARVAIRATRPHRVRGAAWPLRLVAVGPTQAVSEQRTIRVEDPEPGRILLTVTEDHEIHEERGTLAPDMLRRLLVDKSRFAADHAEVPWTHMIEAGSTLAMTRAADEWDDAQGPWQELYREVRRHLAEEVARGNDLQPHLHAFNDPQYDHYPYSTTQRGWRPNLRFLATAAERRGDWASACPPPGQDRPGRLDRLMSVERAVALVEAAGGLGSPDYRAVLWRSGLLEYGDSAADRAWSAVALRRAALLAASDLNKPGSPLTASASAAFFAGWQQPFDPRPSGPLLQLPIAANLEGDYLMGAGLLTRRARGSIAAVSDGTKARPGVHLFTLLTHDKFFNARRGRDEFRLDPAYGDWRVVRRHLDAWRQAGAEVVTARDGVEAVVDDSSWVPVARLSEATYRLSLDRPPEVSFRMTVLGRGISASEAFPQHLLVPVPCFLRPVLEAARIELEDAATPSATAPATEIRPTLERFQGTEPSSFWWRRTSERPAWVTFRLSQPVGPTIHHAEPTKPHGGGWRLRLEAPEPFLAARGRVDWAVLGDGASHRTWTARDGAGATIPSRPEAGGLLLPDLRFDVRPDGTPQGLEIELEGRPAVEETREIETRQAAGGAR